ESPVSCTRIPGAWLMISSRAEGRPRKTGRGPSGKWGAQTVQARTSARSRSKPPLLMHHFLRLPFGCGRQCSIYHAFLRERVIEKRGRIDSGHVTVYKACGIRRVD